MSEYYEFQAVDRELTPRQLAEVRRTSSRAELSPTRFTNFYTFGSFGGNPDTLMDRYYDAHLHSASWGHRTVALRIPREHLDLRTARQYCRTRAASVRAHGKWLILELCRSEEEPEEGYGDEQPDNTLTAILPVRHELAGGDLRLLYLGWLLSVELEEADPADAPPCPPGMGKLSPALGALARFLELSPGALKRAATASPDLPDDRAIFQSWASGLTKAEAVSWLEKLTFPASPYVRAALVSELRTSSAATLARGGFDLSPRPETADDPVAKTRAEHEALLEDALSVREVARLLRVNESQVRQRLGARTLCGVKDGGGWKLPRFQFVHRHTIPSLDVVLPEVPAELHPVALRRWLTSPNPDLFLPGADGPVSPLDWLSSGRDPAPVVELARAL